MAITVRVKMLRDVGGFKVGEFRTLKAADAERLADRGVVQMVSKRAHEKPKAQPKKQPGAKAAPATKNKAITGLKNKSA